MQRLCVIPRRRWSIMCRTRSVRHRQRDVAGQISNIHPPDNRIRENSSTWLHQHHSTATRLASIRAAAYTCRKEKAQYIHSIPTTPCHGHCDGHFAAAAVLTLSATNGSIRSRPSAASTGMRSSASTSGPSRDASARCPNRAPAAAVCSAGSTCYAPRGSTQRTTSV